MSWFEEFLPIDASGNFDFSEYMDRGSSGEHIVGMPIIILVCILAIWFICKFVRRLHSNYWYDSDNLLEGGVMIGNATLLVVTNILIILYVFSVGPAALWFVYPDEDGNWTRAMICGVAYVYCIINLLVGFLKTMDDFSGEIDGRINCKWGLTTLAIGIIALIICAISKPEYVNYVVIILIVCQFIQLGIILNKSMSKGIITALAACGVYMICSIGLLVFAAPFILLLIVLAIVLLCSSFIIKSSMEEDKKRDVLVYNDGRIVDKYNGTEYNENSDGTISPK